MSDPTAAASRPLLRVVRGTPDDAELAAVTAVLLARNGAPEESARAAKAQGGWNDRARMLRTPLRAAPGAWLGSRGTR